ncbi:unnamed protein product [Parascedosporium putredinis]|uniref:LysM domain-containing protein n=1 Tax=Parascedosporium putredinis TaxID=1442378 RepID=A0A9P1HBF5_9PEZI|nr:unnamed protein product [Parascedosporium putredinis]CAI8002755.1 unnamed protein product [Parascedosporium putredinis]
MVGTRSSFTERGHALEGMVGALVTSPCFLAVIYLQPDEFYPKKSLDKICTNVCGSALASWKSTIASSCADDHFPGFNKEDGEMPLGAIPDAIKFTYDLTCLKEGSRYCNNAAASLAANGDPDAAHLPGGLPGSGDWGGQNVTSNCDQCIVSLLRFRASSPYYGGPVLRSSSVYESRTSSCKIAGPTPSASPTSSCAGTTYTIKPGDTCDSVSLDQGIGTEWLINDNDLFSFCRDFPKSGKLCLENKCTVHTVGEEETCKSIAKEYKITEAQLYAWNPSINAGCFNLKAMVDTQICVSKPGKAYVSPIQTDVPSSSPTGAVEVPDDIAQKTTKHCGRYHKAIVGDFCNQLIMKYSISLDDFRFLNPAINENCTNLFAEESYCVKAAGDINTYSGRPGYVSYSLTNLMASSVKDAATELPSVKWSSPATEATDLPLATGTRDDCASYIDGDEFQRDLSGMLVNSNCQLVANVWDVSLEDLEDGMSENCTVTVDVDTDGDPTCQQILDSWELSIAQFYKWNPSVKSDCGAGDSCGDIEKEYSISHKEFLEWNPTVSEDCSKGFWGGYAYCVAVESGTKRTVPSTSTTSPPATTTPPKAPEPHQAGNAISTCNKYAQAKPGDWCSKFADDNKISTSNLYAWNMALGKDGSNCGTRFWASYWYCVGVSK